MHPSSVFLTPLLVFSQLVSAQNTIDEICGGLQGITDCKGTFDFPVKAKLKYCPKKLFQIDPCKTTHTFKYSCPTWSNPTRMCDGSTCVPGTVEKWVDIPCGITVITEKRSLCQAVRDSVGNIGSQFIDKSGAMCSCVPKAFSMIKAGLFQSVSTVGGLLNIDQTLVTEIIRLQKCILDKKLGVKDNRAEVIAKELTPQDGWVVLRAKEIDIATYAELLVAVSPCVTGVICNPAAIFNFFRRYVTDTRDRMALQVGEMFLDWIKDFENMKKIVVGVQDTAESLATPLASLPGKVQTIQKRICQNKLCTGPGVSAFMKKVAKATTAAQTLQKIKTPADTAANTVPKMVDRVKEAIAVSKEIPDSSFFVELITSGSLTKVEDMIQSIPIAKELPQAVSDLEAMVSVVSGLISGYEALGAEALAIVNEVISFSWDDYEKELKADASGKLRTGLADIQTLIRTELDEPLRDLAAVLKELRNVLDACPIKDGNFDFDAGVVSYRRWSELSMDVPCTKKAKSNFDLSGFKTSFTYPQFYSCKYGPQEITWPDHHIPYIKFRLG